MVFLFELTNKGSYDLNHQFRNHESFTSSLAQPTIDFLTSKKDMPSEKEAREIALNTLELFLFENQLFGLEEKIQKFAEEIEEHEEILKNTNFLNWHFPSKRYLKSSPEGNIQNTVKKFVYDIISLDFAGLLTYDLTSKNFEKNKYFLLAGILIPKFFSEFKRIKIRRTSKRSTKELTEFKEYYESLENDYSGFKRNILKAKINIFYTERANNFLKFLQNGESSETSEETSEFPRYSKEETPEINKYLENLHKERLRKEYPNFVFGF